MIRPLKSMMIVTSFLMLGSESFGQGQKGCTQKERYVDAEERCVDISLDDVIALGSLRVEGSQNKRVILHDDEKGDIELLLTPSLVQAVDESPADSYEVEGLITNGKMVVKSLRPIE